MRRALREKGFSAKGPVFYRKTETGNTIMVSVQRSVKSNAAVSEVTLNYGVYSALVGRMLHADASAELKLSSAHWRRRLLEADREKWLRVNATDSPEATAKLIIEATEGVLPDLVEHSSDEALRNEWLSGSSPGLGNMHRLLFLSIILNEIGPAERLRDVLRELRAFVSGRAHQGLIESCLAEAGITEGA